MKTMFMRRFDRSAARALCGMAFGVFVWFGSGIRGNDTGGIIPWSPDLSKEVALGIVADHCNRYGKYGVITSVRPWPGDYVGFACRLPGRWGPVHR